MLKANRMLQRLKNCIMHSIGVAGRVIKSVLTGPDSKSWSPGRIMGSAVFIIGQCLVIRASQSVLSKGLNAGDWSTFLMGVAEFEALDCTTAIALVLGMAPADPFGKWWDQGASSPSDIINVLDHHTGDNTHG